MAEVFQEYAHFPGRVLVRFVKNHPEAKLPVYATDGAAGADVHSVEARTILPTERALVRTGLKCSVPRGHEIQVRPRSGLAFKNGITVLNSPGTIDSDYQGELFVLMINHGDRPFSVAPGDRIAQIIVSPVHQAMFQFVEAFDEVTARGEAGLGSTGVK